MDAFRLEDHAALAPAARAAIERVVREHRGLDDVQRWCAEQKPPLAGAEVVAMDEFTHDLVVPRRDGLYLVYDTT